MARPLLCGAISVENGAPAECESDGVGEKYIDMKATETVAFLIECSKECRKLALSDGIEQMEDDLPFCYCAVKLPIYQIFLKYIAQ